MAIRVCAPDKRGIQRVVEEIDDPARIRHLATAVNAKVIRRRKTGEVTRIVLKTLTDDTTLEVHRGNPRRYSHDHENDFNPPRCWTLRRLPAHTKDLYRLSVTDCLKKAA